MLLVDLKYNFECDWFVELPDNKLSNNKLSDNKLSDSNLASELVGNRRFLRPITIEEIVIFIILNRILCARLWIRILIFSCSSRYLTRSLRTLEIHTLACNILYVL